ncbi:MAG TPA: hypothetical protein VF622_11530 [Segetibacter sp.]
MKRIIIIAFFSFTGLGAIAQSTARTSKVSTSKNTTKTAPVKSTAATKAKTAPPEVEIKPLSLTAILKKSDSSSAPKPDTLQAPKQ